MNQLDVRVQELIVRSDDADSHKISGVAIVYNQPSEDMGFIEYIEPSALEGVDLSKVLLLYSHDYQNVLASVNSETLVLENKEDGLHFSAELANTTLGNDVAELIATKRVSGMSFGFIIADDGDKWEQDKNGNLIHTVTQIESMSEISITPMPAYSETSVSTTVKRSLDEFKKGNSMTEEEKKAKIDALKAQLAELEDKSDDKEQITDDKSQEIKDKSEDKSEEPKDDEVKEPVAPEDSEKEPEKRDEDDSDLDIPEDDSDDSEIDPEDEVRNKKENMEEQKRSLKGIKEMKNLTAEKELNDNIRSFEDFVRSHGEKRDGLTTVSGEAVVPVELLELKEEKLAPNMLKQYVNRQLVQAPSGTLPILKKASAGLATAEELAENPELAIVLEDVDYKVATYRGALPISQEMIDDSAVNIASVVAEYLQNVSAITEQRLIGGVLKTATAKQVIATVDDLKTAVNVTLPAGYDASFVLSQSLFNTIDQLKDANGRYLLQDSIASATGKVLLGHPVYVVEDAVIGAGNGFVGDLNSFVLDAVRADATAKWVDNDIYGQKLMIALRLNVVKAIDEAGVFLSTASSK